MEDKKYFSTAMIERVNNKMIKEGYKDQLIELQKDYIFFLSTLHTPALKIAIDNGFRFNIEDEIAAENFKNRIKELQDKIM